MKGILSRELHLLRQVPLAVELMLPSLARHVSSISRRSFFLLTTSLDRPRSPINEFSLVPSLPSPTAAELGPSAVNQLMTWGTLNATPRILSKSDDPAEALLPSTPFHIAAPSSREALSHRLSSHASKSLRAKAILLGGPTPIIGRTPARGSSSKSGSMGPPSWTPRRADAPGNLTPAAKRLLDRTTMGTAAARRAEAMGRMSGWETRQTGERDLNRVRWTPTPTARGG